MRDYLKKLRESKNLSQSDVAEVIGISQQAYSLIEKGDRQQDIKLATLQKLSNLFDEKIENMIELENKQQLANK